MIIGNQNAITYKEVFKLIKSNKTWWGFDCIRWFNSPKNNLIEGARSRWYTNLDHKKRHEDLVLYKTYNEADYPIYDNYDAVEVGKNKDIPMNYKGAMGVPITFLDKYNPKQFEIIWTTDRGGGGMLEKIKKPHGRHDVPVVSGKGIYKRIIIKNKKL